VSCIDDIPVAQNASYLFTSSSGAVLTGALMGSDVDGDPLTYAVQVTPFTGSILLTSTGYFEYTIPTDYSGLDTISFVVNDGTTNSAPATLSICIIPPSGSPRPACAPALPPTPSSTPTAGPGGGGGGG
jgi:Bacterial Ig domain